jgi:ligand-binding sensor domain-containing protein
VRTRRVPLALAVSLFVAACALATPRAESATKLFITNHVNSNQVAGLAVWQGRMAAGTLGGIVLADPATGAIQKILRSPAGLPSNSILCVAVSPSGALWAGTADKGVARLKADGGYRRTLTSFDGLPTDRVQTIYVHGDSIWVGTSGGVALFTENPSSGQVVLRRSDSRASTAGGLVADDIFAFRQVGDTLWCGTSGGLSVFAGSTWSSRAALLAVSVRALELHQDTLWAGTSIGPRRYADGIFTPVTAGHAGPSIALHSDGGALYSGTSGAGGFRYAGAAWTALAGPGVLNPDVNAFETAPDARLWAGTDAGLARLEGGGAWTAFPSMGPAANGSQRAVADSRGVWIATGNFLPPGGGLGCVLHEDGVSWSALTPLSTGGALQPAAVFSLLSDQSGKLWVGHCCSDADPKPRTERYDPSTGAWETLGVANLYAFAEAPGGLVYGGSVEHGNGVYVFDRTTAALLDSLTPQNTQGSALGSLSSNNLRGIAFDSAGRGWFALALDGLDIWDGNGTLANHADDTWKSFRTGYPSLQTTDVVTTGGTAGWVGTVAGLVRMRNDVIDRNLTDAANAALPSLQVKDLELDSGGNLWVATPAGIARIDAAGGAVEHWGTADGLISDDVRALAWDRSRGVLWVGTADGFSEVFPGSGGAGFSDQSYLYPNPLGSAGSTLRLGGITDEVSGEVRDVTGALIRRFRCDPSQNQVWDLRLANGSTAAPGIYLVVLRDGDRSRVLRAAVVR